MGIKHKGVYMTRELRQPHQNVSKLVVPAAVEDWFLNGTDPEVFLKNHKDKTFDKPEDDPKFDFMISTKVPRSSRLVTKEVIIDGYDYDLKFGYDKLPGLREIHNDGLDSDNGMEVMYLNGNKSIQMGPEVEQNRVSRYFVSNSTSDPWLIKIMPPIKIKNEDGDMIVDPERPDERLFNLESGFHIGICTNAEDFDWDRLNFEYYMREIEKLINIEERSVEDLIRETNTEDL